MIHSRLLEAEESLCLSCQRPQRCSRRCRIGRIRGRRGLGRLDRREECGVQGGVHSLGKGNIQLIVEALNHGGVRRFALRALTNLARQAHDRAFELLLEDEVLARGIELVQQLTAPAILRLCSVIWVGLGVREKRRPLGSERFDHLLHLGLELSGRCLGGEGGECPLRNQIRRLGQRRRRRWRAWIERVKRADVDAQDRAGRLVRVRRALLLSGLFRQRSRLLLGLRVGRWWHMLVLLVVMHREVTRMECGVHLYHRGQIERCNGGIPGGVGIKDSVRVLRMPLDEDRHRRLALLNGLPPPVVRLYPEE
mmetsp:Transcript_2169/g.6782  ORF Transcript_2169/g.6782 Transcript_2169/m.6782 type:complete len:309 (+) Transcript_2169:2175-3101(+)|eukprot:scaffold297291_cov32-Tisochrysis_lutea.AAC.5